MTKPLKNLDTDFSFAGKPGKHFPKAWNLNLDATWDLVESVIEDSLPTYFYDQGLLISFKNLSGNQPNPLN